eukprot:328983_1
MTSKRKRKRGKYCTIFEDLTEEQKEDAIQRFRKTKVYVKTHNITGLKYMGKSTLPTYPQVHKYHGSGPVWLDECRQHGFDYSTEIIGEFNDAIECYNFCIAYSKEHDIKKSDEWANKMWEDGLGLGSLYTRNMNEKERAEHGHKVRKAKKNMAKGKYEQMCKNISKACKRKFAKMSQEERTKRASCMLDLTEEQTIERSKKQRIAGKLRFQGMTSQKNKQLREAKKQRIAGKLRFQGMTPQEKHARSAKISKGRKGVKCKPGKCPTCGVVMDIANLHKLHGKLGEKCGKYRVSKETMNQRAQTIRNDPIICNFCGTKGTKRNIKVYHGAAGEICSEKKGPVFKILDEANIPYNKTQKLSKLKYKCNKYLKKKRREQGNIKREQKM